jgi:hypothetical protein
MQVDVLGLVKADVGVAAGVSVAKRHAFDRRGVSAKVDVEICLDITSIVKAILKDVKPLLSAVKKVSSSACNY